MRRSLLGILLWVGCAGGPEPGDDPGPTTGDTGTDDTDTGSDPGCAASFTDALDGPSFEDPAGELIVNNEASYPYLSGTFASGPPLRLHHEAERSSSCRLLRYEPSSCDPGCAPGTELCVDGACVAFPTRLDAGRLTVGLDGEPEVLTPDGTTSYFAELDAPSTGRITVEASGDELPAFSAETCAVGPVRPVGSWDDLVADRAPGADLTLAWDDPSPGARVSLRMITGVGTHGGISHVEIECEDADTGSLTIDGSFLDELYSEGWSCGECGTNVLHRYRSGSADLGSTDVRLTVRAGTGFWHIPGLNVR